MDTSSKAWLPHQSQFGLVGQAEVCCSGPGVNLTPSESADPLPPPPPPPPPLHHAGGSLVSPLSAALSQLPLQSCCGPMKSVLSIYIYVFVCSPPSRAKVCKSRRRPCCQCYKKFLNMHSCLCCTILLPSSPPCPF